MARDEYEFPLITEWVKRLEVNPEMCRETVVDEIQLLLKNQSNLGALLCALLETSGHANLDLQLREMIQDALKRQKSLNDSASM